MVVIIFLSYLLLIYLILLILTCYYKVVISVILKWILRICCKSFLCNLCLGLVGLGIEKHIGHCWSFSWANIKLWARLPSLCWHGSLIKLWSALWKTKIPNPIKVLTWRACHNEILTYENLGRWGVPMEPWCPLCKLQVQRWFCWCCKLKPNRHNI